MKKILLFSIALMVFKAAELRAQDVQFGIRAGINSSAWGGDAARFLQDVISYENAFSTNNRLGYQIGGYLVVPITSKFVLEPALMYTTKGQEVYQTLFKSAIINPKLTIANKSHYIDLPVIAKYFVSDGFFLFGGPQVSYLVSNSIRAEAGVFGVDLIDQRIPLRAPLRKLDFGMTAGLGYQFANGFNISAGYDHGFSSLDKWGSTDITNRVIRGSIGYTFK